MKVIGFCGLPGAGKSTALDGIIDLGTVITMGDVIREEAKKRNVVASGENLGKIAKELRKQGGPEIIAKKCVNLIKNTKNEVIFVDGVRSLSEIDIFRKEWKFPMISIALSDNMRFKRLYERARSDDPKSMDGLIERDERELGFGLKDVVNIAEFRIINDLSVEDLKKKTRDLVLEILQNY